MPPAKKRAAGLLSTPRPAVDNPNTPERAEAEQVAAVALQVTSAPFPGFDATQTWEILEDAYRDHEGWQAEHGELSAEALHAIAERELALAEAEQAYLASIQDQPAELEQDEEPEDPEERAFLAYKAAVANMDPDEPIYVATRRSRRLKSQGHLLSAGDVVPGAAYFARLQSWVDSGQLERRV